jgi:hypothetical protein
MSWLVIVVAALSCWTPPVMAPVERTFEAPACTWCPGHRGLRYTTAPGTPVVAPAGGRVSFAGTVAGGRWVTVSERAGRRITLGPLRSGGVLEGSTVVAGQAVGRAGDHLLLTVRTPPGPQPVYLDPWPLVGRWSGRPRLVPTDGSAPPPSAGRPVLRCPGPQG